MDARSEPVFRLAGTRMCATYGRELKGHAFTPIWSGRDQPMMSRLAGNVFRDKFGGRDHLHGHQPWRAHEPLRDAAAATGWWPVRAPRLLGCALPVKKPFWLGADTVYENRLETLRMIDPDREPLFLKNRPPISVPRLTDAARPPSPAQPVRRHVRHLLVIEGGKADG